MALNDDCAGLQKSERSLKLFVFNSINMWFVVVLAAMIAKVRGCGMALNDDCVGFPMGRGACRGRGWKTVPGFPISKGYKSKSACEKDCKRTNGCTAYDIARKKGNKWDCHLFGHGNVIADNKIRGICH